MLDPISTRNLYFSSCTRRWVDGPAWGESRHGAACRRNRKPKPHARGCAKSGKTNLITHRWLVPFLGVTRFEKWPILTTSSVQHAPSSLPCALATVVAVWHIEASHAAGEPPVDPFYH